MKDADMKLQKALAELKGADAALADSKEWWFLKTAIADGSALVSGNKAGLVGLARQILQLACEGQEGSHLHFDEVTLDQCEMPFIVRLEAAPWSS